MQMRKIKQLIRELFIINGMHFRNFSVSFSLEIVSCGIHPVLQRTICHIWQLIIVGMS